MMGKTHMVGGVLAGLAVITVGGITDPAMLGTGMACAVLGSLLPDIDHENAKLPRMNMLFHAISRAVCSVTKHRRFCHTLCFVAAIGILWSLVFGLLGREVGRQVDRYLIQISHSSSVPLFQYMANIEIAPYVTMGCVFLLAGMLSHMLLDTLNPEGIMWLYPFSKRRFHLLSIKTNSAGEMAANAVLILLASSWAALMAWHYGIFDGI